ncbi:hypothetical protein KBT16_27660 [Nostoc sp. CCCryo 231-06]|nr:hypothetical protein [Nostoc sp. CCCryo 231-06]
MPRIPIHIQRANDAIIFNWQTMKFIVKSEAGVFIHFIGDDKPSHLEGEAAKALWDLEYESSHKVYPAPPEEPSKDWEM